MYIDEEYFYCISAMISSRNTLKIIGDNKLPCRTPTVVLKIYLEYY